MINTFADAFGAAGLLAGHAPLLLIVLGALIIVLGVLRLLGLIPRLNMNLFGRRDTPMLDGILMIVIGAGILVFGLVRNIH